jgi:hypothetical protein
MFVSDPQSRNTCRPGRCKPSGGKQGYMLPLDRFFAQKQKCIKIEKLLRTSRGKTWGIYAGFHVVWLPISKLDAVILDHVGFIGSGFCF